MELHHQVHCSGTAPWVGRQAVNNADQEAVRPGSAPTQVDLLASDEKVGDAQPHAQRKQAPTPRLSRLGCAVCTPLSPACPLPGLLNAPNKNTIRENMSPNHKFLFAAKKVSEVFAGGSPRKPLKAVEGNLVQL